MQEFLMQGHGPERADEVLADPLEAVARMHATRTASSAAGFDL